MTKKKRKRDKLGRFPANRVDWTCPVCNKTENLEANEARRRNSCQRIACSKKCRSKIPLASRKSTYLWSCKRCGISEIKLIPDRGRNDDIKYCPECLSERKKELGKKIRPKVEKIKVTCEASGCENSWYSVPHKAKKRKYCSEDCKKKARKVEWCCPICGNKEMVPKWKADLNRQSCAECRKKRKKKGWLFTCSICGREKWIYPSVKFNPDRKYCRKCARVDFKCKVCGKVINMYRQRAEQQNTCYDCRKMELKTRNTKCKLCNKEFTYISTHPRKYCFDCKKMTDEEAKTRHHRTAKIGCNILNLPVSKGNMRAGYITGKKYLAKVGAKRFIEENK